MKYGENNILMGKCLIKINIIGSNLYVYLFYILIFNNIYLQEFELRSIIIFFYHFTYLSYILKVIKIYI